MGDTGSIKSGRASWKDESVVKLFTKFCIDQRNNRGYVHVPLSWDIIRKIILEKNGFNYSDQQFKRKWLSLQKTYNSWVDFVAYATKYGLYPIGTGSWSGHWYAYIEKNLHAERFGIFQYSQYQRGQLGYFDDLNELEHLFGKITPTKQPPVIIPLKESPPDIGEATEEGEEGESSKMLSQSNPISKCSPQSPSNDVSSQKENSRGKKRSSSELSDPLERMLKAMKKTDGPTIEECNQVLDEIKDMDSTMYIAACSIFCESRPHREQWMMLSKKTDEVRRSWIRMVAKRLGLA